MFRNVTNNVAPGVILQPIPVAALSKAYVCGRSLNGILLLLLGAELLLTF